MSKKKLAMASRWEATLEKEREREENQHRVKPRVPSGQRTGLASKWLAAANAGEDEKKPKPRHVPSGQRTGLAGRWLSVANAEVDVKRTQSRAVPSCQRTDLADKWLSVAKAEVGVKRATVGDSVAVDVAKRRQSFLAYAGRQHEPLSADTAPTTVPSQVVKAARTTIEAMAKLAGVTPAKAELPVLEGDVALFAALSNFVTALRETKVPLDHILGSGFTEAAIRIVGKANLRKFIKKTPTIPFIGPLNSGITSICDLLTADEAALPVSNRATTCGTVTLLPSEDGSTSLVEMHELHDGSTPHERVIASGAEKVRKTLQKIFDEMRVEARKAEEDKKLRELEREQRIRAAVTDREEKIRAREKLMGRERDQIVIAALEEEAVPDTSEESLVLAAAKEDRRLAVRLPFRRLAACIDEHPIALQDTGGCNELGNAHASGAVMEAILTGDGFVWVESKSSATTGSNLQLLSLIQRLRPDILAGACPLVRVVVTRCDQRGMGETPKEELASIIRSQWKSLGCALPRKNIVFLHNGPGRLRLAELAALAQSANHRALPLNRQQQRLLKACTRQLPGDITVEERLTSDALRDGIAAKWEAMGVTPLITAIQELAVSLHDVAALDAVTVADSALRVLQGPLQTARRETGELAVLKALAKFEAARRVAAAAMPSIPAP